jgi:hypothetical protein
VTGTTEMSKVMNNNYKYKVGDLVRPYYNQKYGRVINRFQERGTRCYTVQTQTGLRIYAEHNLVRIAEPTTA